MNNYKIVQNRYLRTILSCNKYLINVMLNVLKSLNMKQLIFLKV
jgi:hypothetical protein